MRLMCRALILISARLFSSIAARINDEPLPQLLSHSFTKIVAELLDRAKAGGFQINVAAADSLGDEFLGKSRDHRVEC